MTKMQRDLLKKLAVRGQLDSNDEEQLDGKAWGSYDEALRSLWRLGLVEIEKTSRDDHFGVRATLTERGRECVEARG